MSQFITPNVSPHFLSPLHVQSSNSSDLGTYTFQGLKLLRTLTKNMYYFFARNQEIVTGKGAFHSFHFPYVLSLNER